MEVHRRSLAEEQIAPPPLTSPPPPWKGYEPATRDGDFYRISLNAGAWQGAWREDKNAGKGVVYYRYYPFFCEQFRALPDFTMLEIGLDQGGSLVLWRRYFHEKAHIHGTDIAPKQHFGGHRTRIFQAAQTNMTALQAMLDQLQPPPSAARLVGATQPFHLIVDDASHFPSDTIASFEYLFLHGLLPGGVYSLEDLATSYDMMHYTRFGLYNHMGREWWPVGRTGELSVINYFKEMADLVNRRFESPPRGSVNWTHTYANAPGQRAPSTKVAEWVSMVTFAQSIVIVVKKTADEYRLWPNACGVDEPKVRSGACAT